MNRHARPAAATKQGQETPIAVRFNRFRVGTLWNQAPLVDSVQMQTAKLVLATYLHVLVPKLNDIDFACNNMQNALRPKSEFYSAVQSIRDEANGIKKLLESYMTSFEMGDARGLKLFRNSVKTLKSVISGLNGDNGEGGGKPIDGIVPRLARIDELQRRILADPARLSDIESSWDNVEAYLTVLERRVSHITAFLEGAAKTEKFERVPINSHANREMARIDFEY